MNETHLPPLLVPEVIGRETCYIARLYLGVWADLNEMQRTQVWRHLRVCAACRAEASLYENVNRAMSNLPISTPSTRVDQAVMAAIAARSQGKAISLQPAHTASRALQASPVPFARARASRPRGLVRTGGLIAAVAIIAAVLFATLYFTRQASPSQRALLLPASLTWTSYVLYEVQNNVDKRGQEYRTITYYNMSNHDMNVETVMDNSLDVVMISDTRDALGLDMMHHIAQWDASNWAVDESIFDLNSLKRELRANPSAYLGTMTFDGQQVYRILCSNNLTMLLDKDYMPVNVLNAGGAPVYQTLKMLLPSQVPDSMWDMSIPPGFQMGTLPAKP